MDEVYKKAAKTIFSEPNLDIVYHETLELQIVMKQRKEYLL